MIDEVNYILLLTFHKYNYARNDKRHFQTCGLK